MGFIDSNDFKITCTKCGTKEQARIVQRGSSFGTHWASPPSLARFDATWEESAAGGPAIVSAKCRTCGGDATVAAA